MTMEKIGFPESLKYAERHTSAESDVLGEIDRATHVYNLFPRMISGHYLGRFLSMISHMLQPSRILEIGTYTGYSAICLAEGLARNGILHTIEINMELEEIILQNIKRAGMENKVIVHIGNALDLLPDLEVHPDLVFIDADKINYLKYYEILLEKMPLNSFMIADNVLWSGKVVKGDIKDKEARNLMEFNDFVHADPRVENILLPVRDGIMVIRKKR